MICWYSTLSLILPLTTSLVEVSGSCFIKNRTPMHQHRHHYRVVYNKTIVEIVVEIVEIISSLSHK